MASRSLAPTEETTMRTRTILNTMPKGFFIIGSSSLWCRIIMLHQGKCQNISAENRLSSALLSKHTRCVAVGIGSASLPGQSNDELFLMSGIGAMRQQNKHWQM